MARRGLLYAGGRGVNGALVAGLTSRLPQFDWTASSGAALGMLVHSLSGSRGLEVLISRHPLLLAGADTCEMRRAEARQLLERMGVDADAVLQGSAALRVLAFDCDAQEPRDCAGLPLVDVLAALTSMVPVKAGRRHLLDVELLIPPHLIAGHASAFACVAPSSRIAPAPSLLDYPQKVFGFLDEMLARRNGGVPVLQVALPSAWTSLREPRRAADALREVSSRRWRTLAAAALLLYLAAALLSRLR